MLNLDHEPHFLSKTNIDNTTTTTTTTVTTLVQLWNRLHILEQWYELAIRPQKCPIQDLDLYQKEQDDTLELWKRCLQVRQEFNQQLLESSLIANNNNNDNKNYILPHATNYESLLKVQKSTIPNAGMGLFYCRHQTCRHKNKNNKNNNNDNNTSFQLQSVVIPANTILCYYGGHLHSFQSAKYLVSDCSYLMMVKENVLVDPGPFFLVHDDDDDNDNNHHHHEVILARFINDPLNEQHVNCKYVPRQYDSAVVSTRDICPGEELFVSYGDAYWSQQKIKGTILK